MCAQPHSPVSTVVLPLAIVSDAAMIDIRPGSLLTQDLSHVQHDDPQARPRSTGVKEPMRLCLMRLLLELAQARAEPKVRRGNGMAFPAVGDY